MEQSTKVGDLANQVLEELMEGRSFEQIAAALGMNMARLAEQLDLLDMARLAKGALHVQATCEHFAKSNLRTKAAQELSQLMKQQVGGIETRRRVCVALIRGVPQPRPREQAAPAIGRAQRFLREFLAQGPRSATQAIDRACQEGIALATLHRAKRRMRVVSLRRRFGRGAAYTWSLPENPQRLEAHNHG